MNLVQKILTQNDCYKANRKIDVKGLMLHSVGCNQPSAMVFINNWNKPASQQGGRQVCVHGFVEPGTAYQCLPWNHRGWHGASGNNGSANNTHIGIEMTEPSTIRYTGGSSWVEKGDGVNTRNHVLGTYNTAVELFAYLCKEFHLNPLGDGVIISHAEGYKRGIASNHGDPEHIWRKFGLSMDQFRKDVKAKMGGNTTPETKPETKPETPTGAIKVRDKVKVRPGAKTYSGGEIASWVYNKTYTVDELVRQRAVLDKNGLCTPFNVADLILVESYKEPSTGASGSLYRVQTGAFSVKANADALADKLKSQGFDTYVTKVGTLYKVQVGAYSVKANAEAMRTKLKNRGYEAFITQN